MNDVVCCTIAAKNYLPFARVCAESYIHHHPFHRFTIALIDATDEDDLAHSTDDRIAVVGRSAFDVELDTFLRMATAYTVMEFATALKPSLLRRLRRESNVVIYLDPDIEVHAPMDELTPLAMRYGIVLTPHFLSPLPRDGLMPDERTIMAAGIFNLGFIAVGPGSGAFLDFWAERLRQDSISAVDQQLFTDQRWVDQVPALYLHHVLRDPGFNVAYWNIHERIPQRGADGRLMAAGHPLRFFHFSGFRPEQYPLLSLHCIERPRVVLSQYPEVANLCRLYGERLSGHGYGQTIDNEPCCFSRWPDGTAITLAERRLFREGWIDAERSGTLVPPHAFGPDGGALLRAWLCKPHDRREAQAGLNRLAMLAWAMRPDVQAAYPDPYEADAAGFRTWCRYSGLTENMLPAWAVPEEQPACEGTFDHLPGVNLIAYLTAELGHGEMGRLVHDAVCAAGIPVASTVEERSVSNRKGLPAPESVAAARYSVSVFVVNADQMSLMLATHPRAFDKRYRIGVWAWELETFPASLHTAFDLVDEVWTVSEFVRAAIARHTSKPVHVFPVPIRAKASGRKRDLERGPQFFFAFDFNSIAKRKNALGTVDAFQEAFPTGENARLVIKAINGSSHIVEAERLRMRIAGDARISLVERYLTVQELEALYAQSDAYVSLHRSEGFGLTIAEAMARALPVIATDYSSTKEFFGEFAGWPIPYRLIDVGPGCAPYAPDALWADPDVHAAARAMRTIADDPIEARRRGEAGRAHIMRTRSMSLAAAWVTERLQAAHTLWLGSSRPTVLDEFSRSTDVMAAGRWALDWRITAEKAPRNPIKRAIHEISLQALAPHETQLRSVIGEIYDSTTAAIRLLQARLDETEEEIRTLRSSLHETTRQDLPTHEMLAARDKRMDNFEAAVNELQCDNNARRSADALQHAPVPPDVSIVHCDVGTLILPTDDVILPWIAFHRCWEPDEAQLLAELAAARDGTFIDVGAHCGYHTLHLIKATPGLRRVIAIEADARAILCLKQNLRVNVSAEAIKHIHVHNVAAWNEAADLFLVQHESGNSGDVRVSREANGTPVRAQRLDTLDDVTREPVVLIKTDLQGRDHRAIAGLSAVITAHKPDIVCEFFPEGIEQLGDDPQDVLQGYADLGYMIAPLPDRRHASVTDFGDLLSRARTDERSFLTLWLRPKPIRREQTPPGRPSSATVPSRHATPQIKAGAETANSADSVIFANSTASNSA